MSYQVDAAQMNDVMAQWKKDHVIFAPVRKKSYARFSDTDEIMYDFVEKIEDVEFDDKSDYTFKEIFFPLSETLFFFTEDQVKEADNKKRKAIVFLRSCDLHAVKRFDEIYLKNGPEDYYYKRLRENLKFVVMGCKKPFRNCYCVQMGTNRSDNYDGGIDRTDDGFVFESKFGDWDDIFNGVKGRQVDHVTSFTEESDVDLRIPEEVDLSLFESDIWDEYDYRCINCGRCNFGCPTCTCFTMQDIFYTDNEKAGERRRVHASCMVDGFTDVAGGGTYRKKNGQRMRFRTLHKFYDYNKRFGYHMCVGCGRCDDICPQYITITGAINKVYDKMKEVSGNAK